MLNATYIQQQAIRNLYKLNNVLNLNKVKQQIENLKIREVRHKLGAHSNDYLNRNKNKLESYVLTRFTLSGYKCDFLNNETSSHESVDLKTHIEEHLDLMIELLDKTYEKTINTLYRGNGKERDSFQEKLKDLRIEKEGGMLIQVPDGPKIIVTFTSIVNET